MIKTAISVLGSFVITILLVARLLNAESVSEILVIGSLALITSTAFLYLILGNKRKNIY
jgi:Kef-type K+ transport system membrane component KefB